MKGGYGWAGVDPPGHGGGQGFRRRSIFFFFCVNLHAVSDTGMEHRRQKGRERSLMFEACELLD